MRAVLQRVCGAEVTSQGLVRGKISHGWLILVGVSKEDESRDAHYLAQKIIHLRAFPDSEEKMNLSVQDIKGELLVISQFTLYGDCAKGRRPSFSQAAPPQHAQQLYEEFVTNLRSYGLKIQTGAFQQDMKVSLVNDGPVTFIINSPIKKESALES